MPRPEPHAGDAVTRRGPWGHPVIAAAAAIATVIAGGALGAAVSAPRPAVEPRVVLAAIAAPWPTAQVPVPASGPAREVMVGVTAEAIRANASALLGDVASTLEAREAVTGLLPRYGLGGADDVCAGASNDGCPVGAAATVTSDGRPVTSRPVVVATGERPPTEIYAPTPDLIAVSVTHRQGETVSVYPNVLSGDEPRCDPVVSGYDLLVRPLTTVTTTLDPDVLVSAGFGPDFTARTTTAFDVDEGLTVFLCVEVTTASGEVDYRAQAVAQTADRLLPVISIVSLSARPLTQWSIRGHLPSGQYCGTWRSSELGGDETPAPTRILCDYGARVSDGLGRGILPWSSGDRGYFTVEITSPESASVFTALALGASARCTGTCAPPPDAFYSVGDGEAAAVVRVHWSQGNANGAPATTIGPVTDSDTPTIGPQLDVGTSGTARPVMDRVARAATVEVTFRADETSTYVARLVPQDGCTRPGAQLERSGQLVGNDTEWTAFETVTFAGLCAGSDYQVVIDLDTASDEHTTWGADEWGARSSVHVDELLVPIDIVWAVSSDALPGGTDQAAFITLRADAAVLLDHEGGCFPSDPQLDGGIHAGQLRLGELTRISGVLEGMDADPGSAGCSPLLPSARLGLTFAFDLSLEELAAHPEGLLVRLDHPPGADLSVRAPVSGVLRITAFL